MRRRPLLAFTACWIAGDAAWSLWSGWAAIAAIAGFLLLLAAYALAAGAPAKTAAVCALALLFAAGQRAWVDAGNRSALPGLLGEPDGQTVIAEGRLASPVSVDGDLATFTLRVSGLAKKAEAAQGRGQPAEAAASMAGPASAAGAVGTAAVAETVLVRLRLAAEPEQALAASWRRGDAVRLAGELQLPAGASNFGGFDYADYLLRRHIHWALSVQGAGTVERLTARKPPWRLYPLRWADEARSGIGRLMDGLYEGRDAGYMKGLVAGIQDDVDPAQFDAFSRLGLTHVLAISGLHVGVVVFLLLRLGALLRLTRERSLDVAFAAMPVYMLLTGASPSAVRACLMAMIALYMARRNRLKDGLHLLAASALIMLALNPLVLEDVSFQLSFIVTAGLLLFTPAVTRLLPIPWAALRSAVAVAATAQAVSFPVSIYYFHQFHLLSLLANLLLVPFISFAVMPLGMASVALAALWRPLGQLAADAASWCNRLTDLAVARMGGSGALQTYWPQPSLVWSASAYALLLGAFGVMRLYGNERDPREAAASVVQPPSAGAPGAEDTLPLLAFAPGGLDAPDAASAARARRRRLALLAVAVGFAAWLVWGYAPGLLDSDARVMFLDVGQGDSILIRTPSGKFGLIDTGGTLSFGKREAWRQRRDPYEVGRKTLVPLLKQRGVRALDVLVLTHLDQDHIGGAEAVLKQFPVRRIIFNGTIKPDAAVIRLYRMAEQRGIPMYAAEAGASWQWDRASRLQVLYPPPAAEGADRQAALPELSEQNDRSVTLLLTVYGRRFLLPGDLEADGERELLRLLPSSASETAGIDVLKAGHHGSKTSTSPEWLAYWRPAEAVVSVGRNNTYGHPNAAVLERLESAGAKLFRTDRNGEIQYRIAPDGSMKRRACKAAP